jgi:serine O-acetyltransferase
MIITIGQNKLNRLICNQIHNNFLLTAKEKTDILNIIPKAIAKSKKCFSENTNKYYRNNKGELTFNPYHSGQYATFLYFLSREAFKNQSKTLADKIYYLNKMLNCCELYYEVKMPATFHFDHPLGSVMGRAIYGNHLIFTQNCTIGNNHGIYPKLGNFVWLFPNSTIIGNSNIGDNVFISANAFVKDQDIPDNIIVFGKSPNLILKKKPPEYFYEKSPFKYHKKKNI